MYTRNKQTHNCSVAPPFWERTGCWTLYLISSLRILTNPLGEKIWWLRTHFLLCELKEATSSWAKHILGSEEKNRVVRLKGKHEVCRETQLDKARVPYRIRTCLDLNQNEPHRHGQSLAQIKPREAVFHYRLLYSLRCYGQWEEGHWDQRGGFSLSLCYKLMDCHFVYSDCPFLSLDSCFSEI